ncbi:MAG: DEAD/DEAH box helicase, partial [Spirochaetales bacterium]|nr:DEAD/DEAH box helicase [Spirochaetales bacterium]
MNREELYGIATGWFEKQGWKPFPFQTQAWTAFLQGKNGLLNAPTGSGKTYALWFPVVLNYIKNNPEYRTKHKPGLKAIWITPLRALSVEIKQAAERVANDLETGLTVGVRTGDTTSAERSRQKNKMPDLLVTTPESMQLMLASKGYESVFKSCSAIIVDEWHELLGTKRGVQTELALSRLKVIAPKLRIWGISATIGNLQQAMEVLLGPESKALANSVMVKAHINKKINVLSVLPEKMDAYPWRGHMGLHLIDEVAKIIKSSKTTLIFTNVRSACEIWFQALLDKYPKFAGDMAMHHGSISRETRQWVEEAIRQEQLKAVVCTSSLDLGVDFAPVETVIQIGGPKGVARFLQRAGRSGHRPGQESNIYFLATHAIELVEASALRRAVEETVVEDRVPYLNSWDVLVQYLVTLAVSDGFYPEKIFREVKSTFCYQAMTEDEWRFCLNFITKGSQSLRAYDEYKKVEIEDDGKFKVNSRAVALRHRMQIGTIVGADRRMLTPETDLRGRVWGRHRQMTFFDWQFTGELGLISDRNFLESYYEKDWDTQKDFDTSFELKKLVDNQSFNIYGSSRVNDFFMQTEWMPKLDHYMLGQPLLFDRLTYFSHSSVGYARLRPSTAPEDPADAATYDPLAYEVDVEGLVGTTRHEIDLPMELFGSKITPYALGDVTYQGQDINGDDLLRGYAQGGVRGS